MDSFSRVILEPAKSGEWTNVRQAEYFAWRSNGGVSNPTDSELKAFLTALDSIADGKAKDAVRIARERILLVRHGGVFHGYHRNTLRYGTALRAVDPDCISQGAFGFCGPAAIAYQLAVYSPDHYAACIFDLHNCEQASFTPHNGGAHVTIRTDKDCQTKYSPKLGMGPADFLILHALRRAAGDGATAFDITRPKQQSERQATPVNEMVSLLQRAGYANVDDQTFSHSPLAQPDHHPEINARIQACEVATKRSEGPLIVMLSHPWLSIAALPGGLKWDCFDYDKPAGGKPGTGRKDPKGFHELHWICVKELQQSGSRISMRFMSWGSRCWHSYDLAQFKHCFYGYITADP